MKILILNPWAIFDNAIGGTERFVEDIANAYKNLGHSVDVYMFSGKSHKKDGVNYISLDLFGKDIIADEYLIVEKFGSFSTLEAYEKMADILDNLIDVSTYDIVHLNSHFFLKLWGNKNRIITLHSNALEFKVLWSDEEFDFMVEIMKNEARNYKTKFVCPSLYYKNEWEKILNATTYYIPHALNCDRLICNESKEKLVKKYNLSNNKIKILLPSRLEPIQKQPKLILEGCAILDRKERERFQIIFTGIDEQYKQFIPELREFAAKYNIDAKFIIFDSIAEAYKLTDLVALPSRSESFGYSALESLSLGIKTILTNIPTFNEIGKGNSCAYFFENNKYDLAIVLNKLLKINNYERKNISHNWLNTYDINLFGERYIKIIEHE